MACSTAQHGSTAPKSSPSTCEAKSWVWLLRRISSSMLPVSSICFKKKNQINRHKCLTHLAKFFCSFQKTVTEAGPSAFATIHENYYYVFVACTAFFLTIAYFYFPCVFLPCLPPLLGSLSFLIFFRDMANVGGFLIVRQNRKHWKKLRRPSVIASLKLKMSMLLPKKLLRLLRIRVSILSEDSPFLVG